MTIIFDEVTGSVEPRDSDVRREQEPAKAPRDERDTRAEQSAIEHWLRRRAWLQARRHAD